MSGLWSRLRNGLARTRSQLTDRLQSLLRGNALTEEIIEELEEILISADVGVDATAEIIERLEQAPRDNGTWAVDAVKNFMLETLSGSSEGIARAESGPTVILVVGVNGVGKTTTIGKLAGRFSSEGRKVIIGAADTFRAAADEQLEVWARRANAEIVRHQRGADAASVAYDAVSTAVAREADVVIIDTAGRLHTKTNLMAELDKIKRVISKVNPTYPHETLLVIDATTGQNALVQATHFNNAVGVTGIALTKLDSSAKGGMILAVAKELSVPIKLVGVGEQIDDLQDFDAETYVEALFAQENGT
jgi:fused signal recognition particle receptor